MDLQWLQLNRGQSCWWWGGVTAITTLIGLCSVTSAALCSLKPSVFELVRQPDFADLALVVEDFVKDHGGSYTGQLTFAGHICPRSGFATSPSSVWSLPSESRRRCARSRRQTPDNGSEYAVDLTGCK